MTTAITQAPAIKEAPAILKMALPYLTYAEQSGAVFDADGMSVADALQAAHLTYLVKTTSFTAFDPTPNGDKEVPFNPDWMRAIIAVYPDGTRVPFGTCGGRYRELQNVIAFAMLQVLIDNREAKLIAAAPYGTPLGSRAFVAMHLPKPILIGDTDEIIDVYLVGRQCHDGNGGFNISVVPQRRSNGTIVETDMPGHPQTWSIYHSGDLNAKIDEAALSMRKVTEWANGYQKATSRMLATRITKADFEAVARKLLPTPPRASDRSAEDWADRRRTLVGLFESVRGNYGAGTVYAAYSAICDYANLHASGKVDAAQARMMRVINGDTKLQRRGWQLLQAMI